MEITEHGTKIQSHSVAQGGKKMVAAFNFLKIVEGGKHKKTKKEGKKERSIGLKILSWISMSSTLSRAFSSLHQTFNSSQSSLALTLSNENTPTTYKAKHLFKERHHWGTFKLFSFF